MLLEPLGPAQIAALIVLGQRGLEEMYSRRNRRLLLARGAVETDPTYYRVVAVTHLAWLAAVFLLIPRTADVIWPLLLVYAVLQVARYWVIATLGPFWTHNVMTLDSAPVVTGGPYRWFKHPNYIVAVLEVLVLPAAFGYYALGVIMAAISAVVLGYKAKLEDVAIAARRAI